ncbi:MAG: nickel-dependent hydrogenase large subunit [Propionibacteriaceae bacterium]|jgi:NAD-reducing hydrogenase large subunit|nr:nickel-dependent hydrogenase large subunit [Propionibacteriaceae bacterium]
MTTRLVLDQILDPAQARVRLRRDPAGRPLAARFDLDGLPRVEGLLLGRPVAQVPPLVERLCGVCPTAHHLAGVRALEALAGITDLPVGARLVRRLLHHGAVLEMQAGRFLFQRPDSARQLRHFAKLAMAAAGSPGHFPVTAVVGGVAAPVAAEARDRCRQQVGAALAVGLELARAVLAEAAGPTEADDWPGAAVAACDGAGLPRLDGDRLRAVAADGAVLVAAAEPQGWDALVAEARPGDPAPRPYLLSLGPQRGAYRVGPVAQLSVGRLTTPLAAQLQADWLGRPHGALAARAVMALHCLEVIAQVLDQPDLMSDQLLSDQLPTPPAPGSAPSFPDRRPAPSGSADGAADAHRTATTPITPRSGAADARKSTASDVPRSGVGWSDGARGLLVHRYAVDRNGALVAAQILTPTAQNEPWLAHLLTRAARRTEPERLAAGLEEAIRAADPCLPCTAAPPGAMGLIIDDPAAAEARPADWAEAGPADRPGAVSTSRPDDHRAVPAPVEGD